MVVSELLRPRDRSVSEGEQHRVRGTEALMMIWQKPEPSTVLPSGGKVNLVVSRGKRRS
jgi:beta-lactam-binding protein with PASTA domain